MTPTNPQDLPLRDIHLPAPVPWWPPAPGWWLLGVLLIAVLAGALWYVRRYRRRAPLRAALEELAAIEHAFQTRADPLDCAQALSKLLRRVVLHDSGSEAAAAVGERWAAVVEARAGGMLPDELRELLCVAPYSPRSAERLSETTFRKAFEVLPSLIAPRPVRGTKRGTPTR